LYGFDLLFATCFKPRTEKSKFVRYQCAKLIGWCVEHGVDYWLLVISLGNEWGQNGVLKIKFGRHTFAGIPEG